MIESELTTDLVSSALAGNEIAIRKLVGELSPVIQARVGRALLRRRSLARGGDVRQRLEDLVQEVYLELFRDGGKVLRAWDPARGMGLRGFVGLVAEQRVAAILRSRRRNPWTEELESEEDAEEGVAPSCNNPERRVVSRQSLERLLDHLKGELSPLGLRLFHRLIVEEEPIASVCAETGMSTSAVQAWSSRLKRMLQKLSVEIQTEEAPFAGDAS